jgi:hypothetical protein
VKLPNEEFRTPQASGGQELCDIVEPGILLPLKKSGAFRLIQAMKPSSETPAFRVQ